jgi:hypothetical protein
MGNVWETKGKLPCEELHCKLLDRIKNGINLHDVKIKTPEIQKASEELCIWFAERGYMPADALMILERTKSGIWEIIGKMN